MKCPECKGYGYEGYSVEECVLCHGQRFVNPMTNDEWRKTCSAEEFAEAIFAFMDAINYQNTGKHITNKDEIIQQVILRWLKEKHK